MPEIMISNISKRYGKTTVLDQVSLNIGHGVFGLLGPNGAGKSTLMRILTTLVPADSGEIQYEGLDWRHSNAVKSKIGYLPQKFSLYKHIKVKEALRHLAVMKGITGDLNLEVTRVLQQVNLLESQEKRVGQLSGGMVRRLGIAQSILGNPEIVIVDEPTVGLDPEERIRFRNILHTLGSSSIVIISSHIVEDIENICEKAALLVRGKIVRQGHVEELKQDASGQIWNMTLSREDFSKRQQEFQIINQQNLHGEIQLRVLSKQAPNEKAHQVAPTLEDAYFYYMTKAGQFA